MDLKRQELRRLRLPPRLGRSPPQPPTASPRDPGCSPIFIYLFISPLPRSCCSPTASSMRRGVAVPCQTQVGGEGVGGGVCPHFQVGGWGTHDGKRAKCLVPHRQRQVSGQTLLRAGSSTLQLQHKLFIHEKAVLSLGVYGSGRGCIPSWLHLGPLPSSQSISAGFFLIHREGAEQQGSVCRFCFVPGIAEDVKSSPGKRRQLASCLWSTRGPGPVTHPLVSKRAKYLRHRGGCAGLCAFIDIYIFVLIHKCINTQVLKGELCSRKIKKMLTSAYKAKSGQCMKTQFFQKISGGTARRTGSYLHPAITAGVTGVLVLSQDYRLAFETRFGRDSKGKNELYKPWRWKPAGFRHARPHWKGRLPSAPASIAHLVGSFLALPTQVGFSVSMHFPVHPLKHITTLAGKQTFLSARAGKEEMQPEWVEIFPLKHSFQLKMSFQTTPSPL